MTGRSSVRVISLSAGGNPVLAPAQQSSANPKATGNLLSALTSGKARTFAQSKPGWFGSTVAVAGSVRAHNWPNALWPRRAPATAARTVAVANATSSARTSSERQRRRNSERSQVSVIRMPAPPAHTPARRAASTPPVHNSKVDAYRAPHTRVLGPLPQGNWPYLRTCGTPGELVTSRRTVCRPSDGQGFAWQMGETRARLGIERLPDTAWITQCSSGLAQPCRLSGAIKAATGTAGPA